MSRQSSLLSIAGTAVAFTVVSVVVSTIAKPQPKAIEAAPDPKPDPVTVIEPPVVICHPRVTLPWSVIRMNPPWCAQSEGYYTCWRSPNHRGRHVAYDFSTGEVVAVWPCDVHFPAIEALDLTRDDL